MHETALIATVTAAFACALAGGMLTAKLGLSPLPGYLLAGVAIGPFTPGFVGDTSLAGQLAEIGVVLLMFDVGMHFSLRDLMAVRRFVLPGALITALLCCSGGFVLTHFAGYSAGGSLVFGLALSVSSTVVLLRALNTQGLMQSTSARLVIGWLVVEDLLTVMMLVALPVLAGTLGGHGGDDRAVLPALGLALVKVVVFGAVMLGPGGRAIAWLLGRVASSTVPELFTLAVVTLALGIGFGVADMLGLSYALGAFFAGMVVHGTDYGARATQEIAPLQNTFAVLFFVAVGMLFDPRVLLTHPAEVAAVAIMVVVIRPLIAFAVLQLLRLPGWQTRIVAGGLAQIGEFSFVLAAMGQSLGLLGRDGQNLILAGALVAITLNPLVMRIVCPKLPE